nr:transmembrane protein, putative [Tanacetum cinerariifolium]GEX42527.1 transmembrane protein, putative [Tanacetum cinerariifolium]
MAALASSGVLIFYHNLGPSSHQYSICNATMWYNERSEKSRKAVTPSFSLCCQDETVINEDGYPVYRRRDNKIIVVKGKFTYDNRHVVPHNRGAESFTYLKMVNKINYATFKAACFAYGLLNDDKEWTHAIAEANHLNYGKRTGSGY